MFASRLTSKALTLTVVFILATAAVTAGDIEKKWRLSLGAGMYNANDEIQSDAGNVFLAVNPCLRTQTCTGDEVLREFAYIDPRDDSAVFGNLDAQSAPLGTLSVQYGLTKIFAIEGSIGYQKGDVGDVEVSVEFSGDEPPIPEVPFAFQTFRIQAGELERVPIQLTALARLRPRANFNPYFGAGIGYSIIGFETDDRFDELSQDIDSLSGQQLRVTDALFAFPGLANFGPEVPLEGATVDARDTFEWHMVAGAEFELKRRWSLFVDIRWVDASRRVEIGFDNGESIGIAVPQYTDFSDTERSQAVYGPVRISGGGLIDGGQLVEIPSTSAPPNTDCADTPEFCVTEFFTVDEYDDIRLVEQGFVPDGEKDPGAYYVQGGKIPLDGFTMQFGARFTF